MNAPEQMTQLLQQWLQLTRAESAAIRAEAWPKLLQIQSDKARLQQPLNQAKQEWKAQAASLPRSAQTDKPFRAAIARLIALEQHNAQLVAARQQKTKVQMLHLGRATRNLLKIKKSYAAEASLPRNSWM